MPLYLLLLPPLLRYNRRVASSGLGLIGANFEDALRTSCRFVPRRDRMGSFESCLRRNSIRGVRFLKECLLFFPVFERFVLLFSRGWKRFLRDLL